MVAVITSTPIRQRRQRSRSKRYQIRVRTVPARDLEAAVRDGEIEAARDQVRDLLEIGRPARRADCQPCPTCQEVRDGIRSDLACGHSRSDMIRQSRPCLFVACRYNLYLDVTHVGSIKLNYPQLEPGEMIASCTLDAADEKPRTLEEVGELIHVTRERARQLELAAVYAFKLNGKRLR